MTTWTQLTEGLERSAATGRAKHVAAQMIRQWREAGHRPVALWQLVDGHLYLASSIRGALVAVCINPAGGVAAAPAVIDMSRVVLR